MTTTLRTLATACAAVLAGACVSAPESLERPPSPSGVPRPTTGELPVIGRPAPRPGAAVERPAEAAPEPAPPAAAGRDGALRQTQLLAVVPAAEGGGASLRVATAVSRGEGRGAIELHQIEVPGSDARRTPRALGAPEAVVELPHDVLASAPPPAPRPWRVVDVGGMLLLVAHDDARARVRMVDVESGRVLFEREDCPSLEDVRVRDGGVDLLVRTDEGFRMIELTRGGSVRGWRELPAPDTTSSVAAFVAGDPGTAPPHEAVVVGFRAGHLVAVRADLIEGTARSFVVEIDDVEEGPLCVDAWGREDLRRVAIGMPESNDGAGRVVLVADDEGVRPEVLHDLSLPNEDGEQPRRRLGRSLLFVADVDGAGTPELAVAAPGTDAVDLVDHATGSILRRFQLLGDTEPVEGALSTDATGRFVSVPVTGGEGVETRAIVLDTRGSPGTLATLRDVVE